VNFVYAVLEWVDYYLVSPVSRRLMDWRAELLDRHCRCEKCQRRELERQREQESKKADA
jgi:hypothetical protein